MSLCKKFAKLIHGLGINAQSAESSSTSVLVTEAPFDHQTPQHCENTMNELLILRAAMEDIAAAGSEKANIAIVLADQARKLDGVASASQAVPLDTAGRISDLVQRINLALSDAISSNATRWSRATDGHIERARKCANEIGKVLIKAR